MEKQEKGNDEVFLSKIFLIALQFLFPLFFLGIYALFDYYLLDWLREHYSVIVLFIYAGLSIIFFATPVGMIKYFSKTRMFNQWLLPLPYVLLPVVINAIHYSELGWRLQPLIHFITVVFYCLPLILASLIVALTLTIKDRKRTASQY